MFRLSKHKELPYSPALQRRNLFHSPQPQSRNLKEHSPGAGAGVSGECPIEELIVIMEVNEAPTLTKPQTLSNICQERI